MRTDTGKIDGRILRGRKTKERILDEAALLVEEGGLDQVAVKNLAARAGLSLGALYRHFGGVDDVVLALRERALRAWWTMMVARDAEIAARVADVAAPCAALVRVVGALASYRAYALRAPQQHLLLDGLLSAPGEVFAPDVAARFEEVLRPVLAEVEGRFAAAVAAGALAPGDAVARTRVAWGVAMGLFHLQKRDRLEGPAAQSGVVFAEAARALLVGWGAAPALARDAVARAGEVLQDVDGSP